MTVNNQVVVTAELVPRFGAAVPFTVLMEGDFIRTEWSHPFNESAIVYMEEMADLGEVEAWLREEIVAQLKAVDFTQYRLLFIFLGGGRRGQQVRFVTLTHPDPHVRLVAHIGPLPTDPLDPALPYNASHLVIQLPRTALPPVAGACLALAGERALADCGSAAQQLAAPTPLPTPRPTPLGGYPAPPTPLSSYPAPLYPAPRPR